MTDKGTILVVDDDPQALPALRDGLTQAGYAVLQAENSDDAILLAREQRPDVALLDVRLAGRSGFDVAVYLRDYLRMPFIFVSEFPDDDSAAQFKALGAEAYIVKPLDMTRVVAAVEEAFAHIGARRRDAERTLASPADDAMASTKVAIAVGILMHRYSLGRRQALDRLKRLAELRTVEDHAERLIDAVELLAAPPASQPPPPSQS